MRSRPDKMKMILADNARKAGEPRPVWMGLVCDAYGIDHNWPKNRAEAWLANAEDRMETRARLAWKNNNNNNNNGANQ